MMISMLGAVLGAVRALTGCAAPKLPGAAGEVGGPLLSLEFYVGRPEHGVPYATVWRERLWLLAPRRFGAPQACWGRRVHCMPPPTHS
jgi:hypothetical protein